MGRGFKLYHVPPNDLPLLATFEPAPFESIGTVDEQFTAWQEWITQSWS